MHSSTSSSPRGRPNLPFFMSSAHPHSPFPPFTTLPSRRRQWHARIKARLLTSFRPALFFTSTSPWTQGSSLVFGYPQKKGFESRKTKDPDPPTWKQFLHRKRIKSCKCSDSSLLFNSTVKKDDPLVCFWESEPAVFKALEELRPDIPGTLAHFRQTQSVLLHALLCIYHAIPQPFLLPRDYLKQATKDVQALFTDVFSEPTLFAAQAIVQFHPPSTPLYLFQRATYLVSTLVATFHVLHSLSDAPPYSKAWPVLKDFDQAWVQFEEPWLRHFVEKTKGLPRKCSLPSYLYPSSMHYEVAAVYLDRAFEHLPDSFYPDLVHYSPILFVVLPRFMYYFMAKSFHHDPWLNQAGCLQPSRSTLETLSKQLNNMSTKQLRALEQSLLSQPTTHELPTTLLPIFHTLCEGADVFQKHHPHVYSKLLQFLWAWKIVKSRCTNYYENELRLKSISVSVSIYYYLRYYEQMTGFAFQM